MDVRLTVPNDLVVRASELQDAGLADQPRRAERHARRRSVRDARSRGEPVALLGAVNTVRGTYDFQGRRFEILRDGTVRFDGAERLRSAARHPDAAAHPGRRGERQRPRHAEAAGDRADQHAAARAGRHPVADRLQPADQLSSAKASRCRWRSARRRWRPAPSPAQLAQSIGNALSVDMFEISTRAGERRRRGADDRPAARAEPLREGAAGDRRSEPDQLHPRVRAHRVAAAADQRVQGSSTQQQLFQRMQGSGVDLLFFFSY